MVLFAYVGHVEASVFRMFHNQLKTVVGLNCPDTVGYMAHYERIQTNRLWPGNNASMDLVCAKKIFITPHRWIYKLMFIPTAHYAKQKRNIFS